MKKETDTETTRKEEREGGGKKRAQGQNGELKTNREEAYFKKYGWMSGRGMGAKCEMEHLITITFTHWCQDTLFHTHHSERLRGIWHLSVAGLCISHSSTRRTVQP